MFKFVINIEDIDSADGAKLLWEVAPKMHGLVLREVDATTVPRTARLETISLIDVIKAKLALRKV